MLLAFEPSLSPFIVLLAFGFIVGILGHITNQNWLVVMGIAIVFLATVILPLVLFGNPY